MKSKLFLLLLVYCFIPKAYLIYHCDRIIGIHGVYKKSKVTCRTNANTKKPNILWNKEQLPLPPAWISQRELDRTSAYPKAHMWKWVLNGLMFLFLPRCGHSPFYRSREMAARALVPFVMTDEIPDTIRTLLARLPDCTDQCFRQNHIHGTLLQVIKVTLCDICQIPQNELWFLIYYFSWRFDTQVFKLYCTTVFPLLKERVFPRCAFSILNVNTVSHCDSVRSSFALNPVFSTACFSVWTYLCEPDNVLPFLSSMPAEHSGPLPVQGEVASIPWKRG